METLQLNKRDLTFLKEVEQESGEKLSLCYQCGKCTAGCPASFLYDKQVSQVMRSAQLGFREETLTAKSLWLCLSCSTCTARCPNNIDVAKVMDLLRHKARREGYVNHRPVEMFWKAFLDTVRYTGRSYEMGTMADFMMRTGRFYTDLDIALPALKRNKLPFFPHLIKGKDEIGRIFERHAQLEAEKEAKGGHN